MASKHRLSSRGGRMSLQQLGVLTLLLLSATAIAVAPLAMPEGYSWISNAISESAAQGQERAWVARLGFLLYGFAVLWLVVLAHGRWGRWGSFFPGDFFSSLPTSGTRARPCGGCLPDPRIRSSTDPPPLAWGIS